MKVYITKTKKVEGKVKISGSKNSSLPILALSLLTNEKIILNNVPIITDVLNMIKCLKHLGVKVQINNNQVVLKRNKTKNKLLIDEANKIRASYYLYSGMLKYHNNIYVSYPGGCNFTIRPIDFHMEIFKKTGVKVRMHSNYIELSKKTINNATHKFKKQTVGATINAIIHSVFTKGTTKILDQIVEPEIEELITCLKKMGANISIINNDIVIKGVKRLNGLVHTICPDRIELGSFILLASALRTKLKISNVSKMVVEPLVPYLNKLNINYIYNKEELFIDQKENINNIDLKIKEYPSFPTDLQPILCATLLTAKEKSTIVDLVYPNRITHIKEIQKFKGDIYQKDNVIHINPSKLISTTTTCHDLRCGFALVICALLSKNTCVLDNFEMVERGYENILEKLNKIGVQIK